MRRLTVGSLFSGIGGFDLGFARAGFEIAWQVEIDPFCRAVLEKHWPTVRRYEDVRTVGSELERVDVLCGGFPCQDISVAGRGAGIDGARSGLWSHFARLIGELRPAYVVVENVTALLTRGLGRVLGDLAARGYDAEWDCLPASAFGANHRRDRIDDDIDNDIRCLQRRADGVVPIQILFSRGHDAVSSGCALPSRPTVVRSSTHTTDVHRDGLRVAAAVLTAHR